jgi:hypothetical protein|nr:MAG: hypothetical protein [Bacteriophage sp.]
MEKNEVIEQLKELISDRHSFMVGEYEEYYEKDVEALEFAIKTIENLGGNGMKDLIKIAEEQIEILEEMQYENVLENVNPVDVSKEIRNWCEFIKSMNENTRVSRNEDFNWWKQENSVDRFTDKLYAKFRRR